MQYLQSNPTNRILQLCLILIIVVEEFCAIGPNQPTAYSAAADERFSNYEIRVIRPRFFQKSGRFELGAQMSAIMNNAFVYTFLASGILTYHFTEAFAFEVGGSYGISVNRKEKDVLHDDFNIKTEVFRTLYTMEGAILWTPIYGKVQLPEGRLVYFDTFFSFGGGMTGVEWRYDDMCVKDVNDLQTIPENKTQAYPNVLLGIGQRIFRNRNTALRWDLRSHTIFYNSGDASCRPDAAEETSANRTSIMLQIGGSQFF